MNLFQIESDDADLAVFGFTCTYPRTLIALCLPGITYRHHYWWTRYSECGELNFGTSHNCI